MYSFKDGSFSGISTLIKVRRPEVLAKLVSRHDVLHLALGYDFKKLVRFKIVRVDALCPGVVIVA